MKNLSFSAISNNVNKIIRSALLTTLALNCSYIFSQTNLSIGTIAPDIKLKNTEDVLKSLSSFKGKVVLIDFWGSWCRPCRNENKNLVNLYAQYKDKGFEIFSVAVESNKQNWLNAIQADNITWTQVSDLLFWNSPVLKQYQVNEIPNTFLLDKEGKIIAKGLTGEGLANKLKEIFNK